MIREKCLQLFKTQEEYLGTVKAVNRIQPLVSVNVITYQHRDFIRQCLDGILMQRTSFPFEVVVGDDGSTDGTGEICKEYAERYRDQIRLFIRDRSESQVIDENGNIRTSYNLNWNLLAIRGKYVALCEGDDYWTDPDKLQKQVDFMEAHPDYAIVHHNLQVIYEGGLKKPHFSNPPHQKPVTGIMDLAAGNYIYTASVLYRRQEIDYLPEWKFYSPVGDYVLHMLNAQYGKIRYFNDVSGVYRVHEGGIWESKSRLYKTERWMKVLELLKDKFRPEVNEIIRKQYLNTLESLIELTEEDTGKISIYTQLILSSDPYFFKRRLSELRTECIHHLNELNHLKKGRLFRLNQYLGRWWRKIAVTGTRQLNPQDEKKH